MATLIAPARRPITPLTTSFELLRAMRPKQWLKNIFVFAALVFSQQHLWLQWRSVTVVAATFALFCVASSAIYLINDLVDIAHDRAHSIKCQRPIAAGRVRPATAMTAAIGMLLLAIVGAYVLNSLNGPDMSLPAILLVYVLIQGVAYTFVLKHMVLLDIGTIAGGFVLRAIAGAAVLDIAVTPWLLVCVGLLALFLGVGKRRAELVMLGDGASAHRSILKQYSLPMLDQMLAITTTATLIAYTLFTISAPTLPHLPYPTMLATVPFVFYAVFRYLYLVYQRNEGGSPEEIVIKDHPLALTIVLWGVTVLAGLVLT